MSEYQMNIAKLGANFTAVAVGIRFLFFKQSEVWWCCRFLLLCVSKSKKYYINREPLCSSKVTQCLIQLYHCCWCRYCCECVSMCISVNCPVSINKQTLIFLCSMALCRTNITRIRSHPCSLIYTAKVKSLQRCGGYSLSHSVRNHKGPWKSLKQTNILYRAFRTGPLTYVFFNRNWFLRTN